MGRSVDIVHFILEINFLKEMVEILVGTHGVDLQKETIVHSEQGSQSIYEIYIY